GRSIPLWMIPPAPAESIAAPITIEVKRLDQVEPHKARGFDSIYENALGGKAPMSLNLWLHRESGNFVLGFTVTNWTKVLLKVEEAKIFILDKNGQQLELLRFAEWKYGTEKLLLEANSLLSTKTATIPYQVPPAPPPPTRYTVSGTSRGTYTLTPMGTDTVYVSGQSYSEYQIEAGYGVGEQTAYLATSITTAINNILIAKRNREIRKKDEELDRELLNAIRSIKEDIAEGEKRHFDTTRFLAPDETRIGQFRFKSSGTNDLSSLRVIVALTNATTGKDEFTTFEFRP
ncbi:MAG TPA: hypothetical protein VJX29_10410, partial [Candidatus Acidoferrales bacterium]|nr:hypothetical protein [Candidatus Acidoferrales bacterium]